ncbi:hypothetical protein MMC12_000589 [Toensbergia leucococca]|nr:hypothetical protein [Toensbergia leucococca]
MSRRVANPAADRAAQNQQTIKTILKLEGNKSCADCKRNKRMPHAKLQIIQKSLHSNPRWASWNLGVFVCIRCSGIHRGMGTHISRVKSVDLDSWTDEQLQSVLRWGNARANKYWEAKLAPGHVPSEAKIENFIRTKYESKRWVMEGGLPDPETLDADGDDDVPLNVVQEKAKLGRASSQRITSMPSQPVSQARIAVAKVDLFGDDVLAPTPPARPSTTDTPGVRPPPPKSSVSIKQTKPGDSLLGLDFFGGPPSAPIGRPSSNPSGSTGPSRPDLKQSILSLYASAPRPQTQPQNTRQGSFGAMQSPPITQSSNFAPPNDAFSGLSFTSSTSPPPSQPHQPKASPFAGFDTFGSQRSNIASPQVTSPPLTGGGFFDTGPKPPPKPTAPTKPSVQAPQAQRIFSSSSGFGDFSSAPSPTFIVPKPAKGDSKDSFNFSNSSHSPLPTNAPIPSKISSDVKSAFNLSAPAAPLHSVPKSAPPTQTSAPSLSGFSNVDAWGSNDAWATPEPTAIAPKPKTTKPPPAVSAAANDLGWGGSPSNDRGFGDSGGDGLNLQGPPKVAPDEDFGGWTSAAPAMPAAKPPSQTAKPTTGFGGSDDLFSNVWE